MKWWNHRVYSRKGVWKSSNHFTAKKLMVSKETGFTHGDVTYNIGGGSGVMSKGVWLLQLRDFFSPSSPITNLPCWLTLGNSLETPLLLARINWFCCSSWVPTTIPYHCAAGIYPLPRWFLDTPRSSAWLLQLPEEADWDPVSISLNYH